MNKDKLCDSFKKFKAELQTPRDIMELGNTARHRKATDELMWQRRLLERKNRALKEEVSELQALILELKEQNEAGFLAPLQRAVRELQGENYHFVMDLLQRVLTSEAGNTGVTAGLAVILEQQGFCDRAIEVLRTSIEPDLEGETLKTNSGRTSLNRLKRQQL